MRDRDERDMKHDGGGVVDEGRELCESGIKESSGEEKIKGMTKI